METTLPPSTESEPPSSGSPNGERAASTPSGPSDGPGFGAAAFAVVLAVLAIVLATRGGRARRRRQVDRRRHLGCGLGHARAERVHADARGAHGPSRGHGRGDEHRLGGTQPRHQWHRSRDGGPGGRRVRDARPVVPRARRVRDHLHDPRACRRGDDGHPHGHERRRGRRPDHRRRDQWVRRRGRGRPRRSPDDRRGLRPDVSGHERDDRRVPGRDRGHGQPGPRAHHPGRRRQGVRR